MTLWVVQTGDSALREPFALSHRCIVTGWEDLPDLSGIKDRQQLQSIMRERWPNLQQTTIDSWTGQLWRFLHEMGVGDLVVMPLKERRGYQIGEVAGSYEYREDGNPHSKHSRPVRWIGRLPVETTPKDMWYSFRAHMSLYQVTRNDIERRLREMLMATSDTPVKGAGVVRAASGL